MSLLSASLLPQVCRPEFHRTGTVQTPPVVGERGEGGREKGRGKRREGGVKERKRKGREGEKGGRKGDHRSENGKRKGRKREGPSKKLLTYNST